MIELFEKCQINNFNDIDKNIQLKYKNIINIFKILNKENLPNILLYGDNGSGKHTLLNCFLSNRNKKKFINSIKINSKNIDFFFYKTEDYIEFDLNDCGIYIKNVLQKIIKKYIATKKVNNNNKKIIVINNIHLLKINDQFILRKIIEKNINCSFILIANTTNNLIEPIISRCLLLKVPGFDEKILKKKMNFLIKTENISICPKIKKFILAKSKNNLKQMILDLNYYNNISKFKTDNEYLQMQNKNVNALILDLIANVKNLNYNEMDDILYKLIINHKIKPILIINTCTKILLTHINSDKLNKIVDLNYQYNINMINVSKHIIYLQSYFNNLYFILNDKHIKK